MIVWALGIPVFSSYANILLYEVHLFRQSAEVEDIYIFYTTNLVICQSSCHCWLNLLC